MITITNTNKILLPTNLDISWSTTEGDITYTLKLLPIIGSVTNNPYYIEIPITSSEATVVGQNWSYTIPSSYLVYFLHFQENYKLTIEGSTTSSAKYFLWKPIIPKNEWAIFDYPKQYYDPFYVLQGSYKGSISKITINGEEATLSNNLYRKKLRLSEGYNKYIVIAYDSNDLPSEERIVEIEFVKTKTDNQLYWNHYDEFGIYSGYERKTSDTLETFEKFRKQGTVYRANTTEKGITFGVSTDLRETIYEALAVNVLPKFASNTQFLIKADARYIYWNTSNMVRTVTGKVNALSEIYIYNYLEDSVDLIIEGKRLNSFTFDMSTIKVDNKYIGKNYELKYRYYESISTDNTLATVLARINASGRLEAFIPSTISNTVSCLNIINQNWSSAPLLWASIKVYSTALLDTISLFSREQVTPLEFSTNFNNTSLYRNYIKSEIDSVANELRAYMSYDWENVTLDVTFWNSIELLSYCTLPRLYDGYIRRYNNTVPPLGEYNNTTTFTGFKWLKGGTYGDSLKAWT